jgi:hypothetical protein
MVADLFRRRSQAALARGDRAERARLSAIALGAETALRVIAGVTASYLPIQEDDLDGFVASVIECVLNDSKKRPPLYVEASDEEVEVIRDEESNDLHPDPNRGSKTRVLRGHHPELVPCRESPGSPADRAPRTMDGAQELDRQNDESAEIATLSS